MGFLPSSAHDHDHQCFSTNHFFLCLSFPTSRMGTATPTYLTGVMMVTLEQNLAALRFRVSPFSDAAFGWERAAEGVWGMLAGSSGRDGKGFQVCSASLCIITLLV